MSGRTVMVVLAVLVAGCSSPDASNSPSTSANSSVQTGSETTSTHAPGTTTSASTPTTDSLDPDEVEVSDEVLDYLAAVEELLAETSFVDAVTEAPEVFIATGFLFCEQLGEGMAASDVLTMYVEALTGDDIAEADDDESTLAGSMLGAAVGNLCPEHTELIENGL